MKLVLLLYYFFRSIVLRGLINTIKLLRAENYYEKQFAIETAQFKKSNSTQFYHYQGASYLVLLKILPQVFKQTQNFTFFDIGCGKGRAMFVAASCGYKKLIGIDLDRELILAATKNSTTYFQKNNTSEFTFLVSNALEFEYKNEATVYFMFNPFNEDVLKNVIQKINQFTSSETYFVYMNPKHKNVFNAKQFQLIKTFKTQWYLEALVYKFKSS